MNLPDAPALLETRDITVHYGGVLALDKVSVKLLPSETVALMGPNGAGKSTVLKAIFGLAPFSHGHIYLDGEKLQPVPHEVVERGVAFVPQGRRVFPHLTVEENLEVGGFALPSKAERQWRLQEVLETFPVLKQKRRDKSGTLSGGQQQMLALARGLMIRPRVLLLDEPSLGLAPKIIKEIFATIREIGERHRTAILIVEHNIKSLLAIVDRCYVLDKGRIILDGDVAAVRDSEILQKVFVGKLE